MVIPQRVAHRAFTKWVSGEDGCRISTYSVASHGYAQIGWQDDGCITGTTAHRAAWVYINGQIPEDMTIDHVCNNRRCVNVEHLRVLSNFENSRRKSRDWPLGQCVNGHPNSDLIIQKTGRLNGGYRLRCHLCKLEYQRRYRQKKRALKVSF
jgi:HNH endonuclease